MTIHGSGSTLGTRQGTLVNVQTIPVSYADTSASAKKLLSIAGTTAKPIMYRIAAAVIQTANNAATTATLSVGITGAGYTDLINAQDLKAAAGTNITLASGVYKLATTTVDIYAISTFVGTPTAGLAHVLVETIEVNLKEPTTQGS